MVRPFTSLLISYVACYDKSYLLLIAGMYEKLNKYNEFDRELTESLFNFFD